MTQFFSEPAPKDYKERDKQSEIMADYRLCYDCMGTGKEGDRQYLADKYNRPIKNVADLFNLGYELYGNLSPESQESDRYDAQRKLDMIGNDKDADYI